MRSPTVWGAVVLGCVALGCTSASPEPTRAQAGGHAGAAHTGGASQGGGGSPSPGGSPTSGGSLSGGSPTSGGASGLDSGRKDMHRLNTAEYNATIEDVLGTTLQPANGSWRGGELAGFDNIASVLGVDEAQYDRYFKAAETLARDVFASDELRDRFVSCEPSEPGCVQASIEAAGLRLFRRPLAPDEVATYQRVHDAALELGDSPLAALELAFQALLSSAEFLYRVEVDPEPQSPEAHPLGAFELATRLSYFLWSSAPDRALLELAADDSLLEPNTLAAAVDHMLDDRKSERLVSNFAGQWLGTRQVISHPVAPTLYQWSPGVARAAGQEMLSYFAEFLRSERSWFEFPTADINYVDGWLSAFYGMPTPEKSPERVEFSSDGRAGFFGLAGFLALTSFDRRTSPSLRGRWIAGNLLCRKPPDPPPNVPKLEDSGGDSSALSVRQMLERHRESPDCAPCHALFDPYGFALEEYDAVGQYRSAYADGTPVDATAQLPDGSAFTGLAGLSQVVASDPQFGACLAEKLLTYGLGRPVSASDVPYLQRAQRDWTAPGQVPSIRRLIAVLVATEPFRFRRGDGDARP